MVPRSASLVVLALVLAVLAAGCGDDEPTTVTETVTTTVEAAPDETSETAEDVIEDCESTNVPTISNLSVRNMSCDEANGLAPQVSSALEREPFTVRSYECEILGRFGPDTGPILGAEDVRCTDGDRAFRFDFGD